MTQGFVKNITVGFLIALMLISSLGVSVNTLYCFCTGEQAASLFEIEHTCTANHADEILDETFKNLPPCCQKAMACAAKEKTNKDHDCTKKEKKYVKADLKFLKTTQTLFPNFCFIAPSYAPLYPLPITPSADFNAIVCDMPENPPPQYWGRSWLNFIQVYRI
jgi:hypothetical protein